MRLSKGFLWKTCAPAGILLAGFASLKLWTRSESAQNKLREAISRELRMEIRFERVQTSLRKGLRIKALTGSNPSGSSIQTREIQIRPSLSSLLMGQLVISEVQLDAPRIVWVDPVETAESPVLPPPGDILKPFQNLAGSNSKERRAPVRRIVVENGDLNWISNSGKSRIQLDGISLKLEADEQGNGSGRLLVAKGSIAEILAFNALQAPLVLETGILRSANLSAKSGGGQISASFSADLKHSGFPVEVETTAQGVDLAQMSQELPSQRYGGTAQGALRLRSPSPKWADFSGDGELRVRDGFFKGLALLHTLGQIFNIQELANLKIRDGTAAFSFSEGKILVSSLTLRSDEIRIEAPGTIDQNTQLSLNARLSVPERMLSNRNIQTFLDRFTPADPDGRRAIDFHVSGTLEKPRTNLMEKIVPGGAGALLQQVIGNFLKPKAPQKKEASDTPPPTTPPTGESQPKPQ